MIEFVELPDRSTAIAGLSWQSFEVGVWKTEKKHHRRSAKAVYELASQGQGKEVLVGQVPEDEVVPIPSKAMSLAALCARTFADESVSIIEKLGEDKYWFCAVTQERVVSGTDVVGNLNEIFSEVTQHQQLMMGSDERLAGSGAGDLFPGESTESILPLLNMAMAPSARIRSGGGAGGDISASKLIGLVAAFGFLGFGAYLALSPDDTASTQQTSAERQRMMIAQANQAFAQAKNKLNEQVSPANLSDVFRSTIGRLPSQADGWELQATQCVNMRCRSTYKNEGFTRISELEHAIDGICENLTVSVNGDHATCEQSIKALTFGGQESEAIASAQESALRATQDTLMTAKIALGGNIQYEIEGIEALAFPGRERLPQNQIPQVGNWSIALNLAYLDETVNHFLRHLPAGVKAIGIQWESGQMQITGQYFQLMAQE